MERTPANQIASFISMLSDWSRPLSRLDIHWSTATYLVVILLPEVTEKKRGNKVKKDDLAESSVLKGDNQINTVYLN